MKIAIPDNLTPLARVFSGAGVPVYAVGGLVRNALLGLPGTDVDVCSRLTPAQTAELCEKAGLRWFDQGARYGTVAILTDAGKVEHTTFRADRYGAGGAHRPEHVRFSDSLTEDAFRRDFSVNALYAELTSGEVSDPTGGLADLERGILRATGENPDAIMESDGVRVLRMVRFSGELGFSVDEDTFLAAKRNAKGLLDVSGERIAAELHKILLCDARYARGDVLTALERLDALGAFDVFWPELTRGRGMAQRPDVHRYDVLTHSLHVCAETPPTLRLRLAGLLHDVGKPVSMERTGRYLSHAADGEPVARAMLTRLRTDNATTDAVCALIARHMFDIQGTARENTLRKQFARWGRQGTRDMIALREADVRGCGYDTDYAATRWRALLSRMECDGTPFSLSELAVSGADALAAGVPAGPAVGEALDALWMRCAARPRENTRERLLKLLVNNRRQN